MGIFDEAMIFFGIPLIAGVRSLVFLTGYITVHACQMYPLKKQAESIANKNGGEFSLEEKTQLKLELDSIEKELKPRYFRYNSWVVFEYVKTREGSSFVFFGDIALSKEVLSEYIKRHQ